MKKVFLTLSFAVMNVFVSLAQVNIDNISNQYNLYQKNNVEGNYDASIAYVNPVLFQFIPQETYVSILSSLNMEGVTRELIGVKIIDVRDSKTVGDVEYVIFTAFSTQKLTLSPTHFSEAEIQEVIDGIKQNEGSEVYEQGANTVSFVVKQKVLASLSEGQHNWKFVEIDNDNILNMLKTVLPEAVFN